ncbi:unnamed protein product [Closterium sp. NIES-64]|nr:unnamed protein product [Closterium sp. NIES-64]
MSRWLLSVKKQSLRRARRLLVSADKLGRRVRNLKLIWKFGAVCIVILLFQGIAGPRWEPYVESGPYVRSQFFAESDGQGRGAYGRGFGWQERGQTTRSTYANAGSGRYYNENALYSEEFNHDARGRRKFQEEQRRKQQFNNQAEITTSYDSTAAQQSKRQVESHPGIVTSLATLLWRSVFTPAPPPVDQAPYCHIHRLRSQNGTEASSSSDGSSRNGYGFDSEESRGRSEKSTEVEGRGNKGEDEEEREGTEESEETEEEAREREQLRERKKLQELNRRREAALLSRDPSTLRYAYVTLLCDDVMAPGALVLVHSLKRTGTPHDVVVLTMNVSEVTAAQLQLLGARVKQIEEAIPYPFPATPNRVAINKPCRWVEWERRFLVDIGEWNGSPLHPIAHGHAARRGGADDEREYSKLLMYSKLWMWTLTEYHRLVYVDADLLVMSSLDDLFCRDELSAAPDTIPPDRFNSGLMVVAPSDDTFRDMLSKVGGAGRHVYREKGLSKQYSELSAAPDTIPPDRFNGGLMVVAPSDDMFRDMLSKVATTKSPNVGDQGLLNNYFSDWYSQGPSHHLPYAVNPLVRLSPSPASASLPTAPRSPPIQVATTKSPNVGDQGFLNNYFSDWYSQGPSHHLPYAFNPLVRLSGWEGWEKFVQPQLRFPTTRSLDHIWLAAHNNILNLKALGEGTALILSPPHSIPLPPQFPTTRSLDHIWLAAHNDMLKALTKAMANTKAAGNGDGGSTDASELSGRDAAAGEGDGGVETLGAGGEYTPLSSICQEEGATTNGSVRYDKLTVVLTATGSSTHQTMQAIRHYASAPVVQDIFVLLSDDSPLAQSSGSSGSASSSPFPLVQGERPVVVLPLRNPPATARFRPIPHLSTVTVLVIDDTILVPPAALLATSLLRWREAPNRLLGFLPSAHFRLSKGVLKRRLTGRLAVHATLAAVLVIDDTFLVPPALLATSLLRWRETPNRLLGFLPSAHFRLSKGVLKGRLAVHASLGPGGDYSVVTGALLLHRNYLHYFCCTMREEARGYLEWGSEGDGGGEGGGEGAGGSEGGSGGGSEGGLWNPAARACADVAMNMLVTHLSDLSPLTVYDSTQEVQGPFPLPPAPAMGRCLNDLATHMGLMPLKSTIDAVTVMHKDSYIYEPKVRVPPAPLLFSPILNASLPTTFLHLIPRRYRRFLPALDSAHPLVLSVPGDAAPKHAVCLRVAEESEPAVELSLSEAISSPVTALHLSGTTVFASTPSTTTITSTSSSTENDDITHKGADAGLGALLGFDDPFAVFHLAARLAAWRSCSLLAPRLPTGGDAAFPPFALNPPPPAYPSAPPPCLPFSPSPLLQFPSPSHPYPLSKLPHVSPRAISHLLPIAPFPFRPSPSLPFASPPPSPSQLPHASPWASLLLKATLGDAAFPPFAPPATTTTATATSTAAKASTADTSSSVVCFDRVVLLRDPVLPAAAGDDNLEHSEHAAASAIAKEQRSSSVDGGGGRGGGSSSGSGDADTGLGCDSRAAIVRSALRHTCRLQPPIRSSLTILIAGSDAAWRQHMPPPLHPANLTAALHKECSRAHLPCEVVQAQEGDDPCTDQVSSEMLFLRTSKGPT